MIKRILNDKSLKWVWRGVLAWGLVGLPVAGVQGIEGTTAPSKSETPIQAQAEENIVEFFLVHQMDLYPGQESVGTSLCLSRDPSGEKARVEVMAGKDSVVLKQDLGVLKERITRTDLRTAALKEGEYRAVCVVSSAGGKNLGRDHAKLRVISTPPAKEFEIPIQIAYGPRVTANRFPITMGVPFGRGVLSPSDVEGKLQLLNAQGEEIPVQKRVVAYWEPVKRSVQWLHLDFLAKVTATATAEEGQEEWKRPPNEKEGQLTYTLRYLPAGGVNGKAPENAVKVIQGKPQWVMDNGLVRVILDPSQVNPIKEIFVKTGGSGQYSEADRVTVESPEGGFFLTDEEGTVYGPSKEHPWKITLEKEGAVMSVVRMDAALVDAKGQPIGNLILRIRQAADLPRFNISHTFVYTEASQTVQITAMGLKLPVKPIKTLRMGMDEYGTAAPVDMKNGDVRFLQSSWYHCTLEQRSLGSWKLLEFADMAPGWMHLDTGDHQVVVNFPAGLFWKEYPKEFYVESSGMVWIGLVPAHASFPMDLRTQLFDSEGNWKSTGFSKTHEFSFDFHYRPKYDDRSNLELSYGAPVAWADHAYMCNTKVAGELTPRDMGDVKAMEWMSAVRKYMWYGVLDYGDAAGLAMVRKWYLQKTGIMDFRAERYHLQHEQIGARWLANNWIAFMVGGNRLAREKCFTITRHLVDVDSIHALPKEAEGYDYDRNRATSYLGGHHNHGGSQQHWSGKALPAAYEATLHLSPVILCYNLTGWERARDTMEEWHQGLLASPDITDEDFTCRRCMGAIEKAAWLYRQTWDPLLLESARQHWNLAFSCRSRGQISKVTDSGFWVHLEHLYHAAESYYNLTGDERVETLLKETPPQGSRATPFGDLLAYRLTGDLQILRGYLPNRLEELVAKAPREIARLSPPPSVPDSPMDWLQKPTETDVHSWVDPLNDLYGAECRDLVAKAIKEGKLANSPSRHAVEYYYRRNPSTSKNAVTFIVKKEAGKPFEIEVNFFNNTVDHTYCVWNAAGKLLENKAFEGLIRTSTAHEGGRLAIKADWPTGLYRVRVRYKDGPPKADNPKFGYHGIRMTLPAGGKWMIEARNPDGYPDTQALRGPMTAIRFVVPADTPKLDLLLSGDLRIGRWLALVDPDGKTAAVVENGEKNRRTVKDVGNGLDLSLPAGTKIVPGVWELYLEPIHSPVLHFLKGALPYYTFAPDAVLTAQELKSLSKAWERDD